MKLKRKQTNSKVIDFFKNYWALLILSLVLFSFIFTGIKRAVKSYLLDKNGVVVRAVIVDDKNFFGNNTLIFAYSYSFAVNGHDYVGNSFRPELKVGDSILIKYTPTYPNFSKPVDNKK